MAAALGTHEASHTWKMLWWDFLKGTGKKGLEAAVPLWTRNPAPRRSTPGHYSSQGAQEGRGETPQVLAVTRVEARQRGFGALEAFVPWAQLGHSLHAICQKSGFIQTQAEASYAGGRRKGSAG